jgi:hypothetical protein
MKRRTKRNLIVLTSLFVLLTAAWFGGGIGWLVRKTVLPMFAPRKLGSSFMIYSFESGERFAHESRGFSLLLSPERANAIVNGLLPLGGHFFPPGLVADGLNIQGLWMPRGEKDSSLSVIPVWVSIDKNVGYEPVLKGRMPIDEVNTYLEEDVADSLSSREEWVFGHYTVRYIISFDSMQIISDTGQSLKDGRRKLTLVADGAVRIHFDDEPISARSTADVKELEIVIDMTFIPKEEKYALSYEAKVTKLRLNVNNVLQWGDTKVSDSLRRSLERSMNRSKNKERAMKLRIPEWAVRDMLVDIQLSDPIKKSD